MDGLKDVDHVCPNCGTKQGSYKAQLKDILTLTSTDPDFSTVIVIIHVHCTTVQITVTAHAHSFHCGCGAAGGGRPGVCVRRTYVRTKCLVEKGAGPIHSAARARSTHRP